MVIFLCAFASLRETVSRKGAKLAKNRSGGDQADKSAI